MFYVMSKLAAVFVLPSTLLALGIAVGLVLAAFTRFSMTGFALAFVSLGGMALIGFSPLANALILPLEERFAQPDAETLAGRAVAGIIILGGAEDGWVTAGRGSGLALNEAAERVTEGLRLALAHPQARVVFTGGVGRLLGDDPHAADDVGRFLHEAGVARDRIVIERRSRNTHQNATMTLPLISPKPGEVWLLVTSAYHMPRSIGVFRKAGLDALAYPVDFRTRGPEDLSRVFGALPAGLARADLAAREYIGLVAYYLTGRTDALFPGPRSGPRPGPRPGG